LRDAGRPRAVEDLSTRGIFLRENRETPRLPTHDGRVGRIGKAGGRKPMMDQEGEDGSMNVFRLRRQLVDDYAKYIRSFIRE